MTFKDLKKILDQNNHLTTRHSDPGLERLRDKPFWNWNKEEHRQQDVMTKGDCCFNHIVGLPTKDEIEKPVFDYQKILYDSLFILYFSNPLEYDFKEKHLWVKKATGLGITEFMLRFIAWLCLRNNDYQNSQICIITGPNIGLAIKLIKRLKKIFETKLELFFDSKETVLELNKCTIEAYPSNHIDSFRALDNPKFILLDEADFFMKGEQEEVRHVSERYIAKSNPYIVMVSTPNAPGGLFENIEKESEEDCIYKRIKLDYTYGVGKIYSVEAIEKAKKSPGFEREYNLKYLGSIGNVFHEKDIQKAVENGTSYDPEDLSNKFYGSSSMGIDCGFGSSAFGIVITRFVNEKQKVQILYAEEYERPDYNDMLKKIGELIYKYNPTKIYVDGANPEFIKSLKIQIGERADLQNYERCVELAKKYHKSLSNYMRVIPVQFSKEHKNMLTHCKLLIEKEHLEIHPRFDKLVMALRTAVENGEGSLEKKATSFDDVFDGFRLALRYYQIESSK